MAMAISTLASVSSSFSLLDSWLQKVELRERNSQCRSFYLESKIQSDGHGRRVWRRRKLTKKDDMLRYKMERIPFLEEQVRKIREGGKLLTMDIERLLLSEDNRFDFVNEVAAEAKEYVERNRDDYGGSKKAILHVLSNRVNDAGFYRPDGYVESDPFKPGPGYLKEEFT
ncbi:protein PLASTID TRANSCRIPTIONALLY ACTIVE 7 isoform X1 [Carica papaya]|uniref:protein PLASTID TRANSCRIPTIONALLY ACTIVE 7 isoform X1 n=1 Tax=Carica papaya TaxID=3649 RepID=UPI000B8CA4BD|nr:protein PLASTID TRANSCRIPTIONALLY ACTIVE 7 isoform X1 [Carica papaya]